MNFIISSVFWDPQLSDPPETRSSIIARQIEQSIFCEKCYPRPIIIFSDKIA